jgi:hypothetical protein
MSDMEIYHQLSLRFTIWEPGANAGVNPAANLNDPGWVVV